MKTRTCSRPTGNMSANHRGHQHLLIPEEPIAQGGEGGDFLVKTLAVLFPCLAFHVKLFLFPFLDKLFSWGKVLRYKKIALHQLFKKSSLSLASKSGIRLAHQTNSQKNVWCVGGYCKPNCCKLNCSCFQLSSSAGAKFCDIICAEELFNDRKMPSLSRWQKKNKSLREFFNGI